MKLNVAGQGTMNRAADIDIHQPCEEAGLLQQAGQLTGIDRDHGGGLALTINDGGYAA
jgi:hypothetical protein